MSKPAEDGGYVYALRTGDQHKNPIGLVHGGVVTSPRDQAMALVAWQATGRQRRGLPRSAGPWSLCR
jgi:acyl-coenzyme A thioesterase PaaI-like protein